MDSPAAVQPPRERLRDSKRSLDVWLCPRYDCRAVSFGNQSKRSELLPFATHSMSVASPHLPRSDHLDLADASALQAACVELNP